MKLPVKKDCLSKQRMIFCQNTSFPDQKKTNKRAIFSIKPALYLLPSLLLIAPSSLATCSLDFSGAGTSINFGNYNPFSSTANVQQLSFISNCAGTPSSSDRLITISPGLNASLPNRAMSSAGTSMSYNLYTDSAYTQVWGNTTGTGIIAGEEDGEVHIIYAQIPTSQNDVSSGNAAYSDVVSVTVGVETPQNLSIQAVVPNTCFFASLGTLSFGQYFPSGPNLTTPLQGSTNVDIKCTTNASGIINIGMMDGQNYSGGSRRMFSSATGDYLNYNIYLPSSNAPDAACSYTTVWDTSSNILDLSSSPPSTTGSSYNICGQIDAGQTSVAPGDYQDSVTIVLTY